MENQEKEQRSRWKVTLASFWAAELRLFANANPVYGITIRTLEDENGVAKVEFNFRKEGKSLQHQALIYFMLHYGLNLNKQLPNPKSQDNDKF